MKQIDKKTYHVNNKNRYSDIYEKKQILIASSLRKLNYHILRLQNKEQGNTKRWCTYTISREGKIFEHYDPKFYSDFINEKTIDKHIISIVLENMGSLNKTPKKLLINSLGEVCDIENVGEKDWIGKTYWEKYPDEQIKSLVKLSKHLCKTFKISKKVMQFHYYHEKTNVFNGIVFRSNYLEETGDINPFMDIGELNKLLN
jgi:N-acetylmuramoyl-L-alanine amidase